MESVVNMRGGIIEAPYRAATEKSGRPAFFSTRAVPKMSVITHSVNPSYLLMPKNVLDELSSKMAAISGKHALVGPDGFVDKIIHPVKNRYGQGDQFEAMATIEEFGQRILAASGKSANIELFEQYQKLGGNGPIMANCLAAEGLKVKYVGALGQHQAGMGQGGLDVVMLTAV